MVLIFKNLYVSPAPDFLYPLYPEKEIFNFIKKGIEIVISLRPDEPLKELYALYEISFYNIPIFDFDIPSKDEDVYKFIEVVEGNSDKKILTHCTAGRGRSGMMAALYLIYNEFKPEEAIKYVRGKVPGAIETLEQEDYVKNFRFKKGEGNPPF